MNVADFKSTIVATSNAWMVEFYSSWCGHCIDFAPAFIELANSVKGTFSITLLLNLNVQYCQFDQRMGKSD